MLIALIDLPLASRRSFFIYVLFVTLKLFVCALEWRPLSDAMRTVYEVHIWTSVCEKSSSTNKVYSILYVRTTIVDRYRKEIYDKALSYETFVCVCVAFHWFCMCDVCVCVCERWLYNRCSKEIVHVCTFQQQQKKCTWFSIIQSYLLGIRHWRSVKIQLNEKLSKLPWQCSDGNASLLPPTNKLVLWCLWF